MMTTRIALVVLLSAVFIVTGACAQTFGAVNNYEECVAAGYKVLKTVPPRCVGPDGNVFQAVKSDSGKKAPRLCDDKCGNGQCEEMVCMGEGCPCAESAGSCPEDCK